MKQHPSRRAVLWVLPAVIVLAVLSSLPSCGGSSGPGGPAPWTILLGTTGDDFAYGVAVDPAGDVLIAGLASGSLDGAPFSGSTDLFLAKFDPSGAKSWIRQRGPAGGIAVAIDGAGNAYVAGSSSSSFDNNTHLGGTDVVLVKYDATGSTLWSVQFGTSGSDVPNAIVVDATGYIFLAGSTSGDLGGTGNAGLDDAFLAKIDPVNGAIVWVEQIGTPFHEVGEGVATDNVNRVFLCGLTFNGDVEGTGSPPGAEDFFVASFLDNGTSAVREWTRQYGTATDEYPVAIGVSDNAVYVAGYANGDLDGNINQGSWDAFLWRMNSADGTSLGVTLLGSAETDFAENLTVDPSGNIYVAGRTNGDLAGPNADPGTDPVTSTFDLFLAKYRADGTLLWARQTGTAEHDYVYGAATDSSGFVYVSGATRGNLRGIPNQGGWEAFLLRYDGNGANQ